MSKQTCEYPPPKQAFKNTPFLLDNNKIDTKVIE